MWATACVPRPDVSDTPDQQLARQLTGSAMRRTLTRVSNAHYDVSRPPVKWDPVAPTMLWHRPTVVLLNHDRSRHASRHDHFGQGYARAKVAATLLLTLRGAEPSRRHVRSAQGPP